MKTYTVNIFHTYNMLNNNNQVYFLSFSEHTLQVITFTTRLICRDCLKKHNIAALNYVTITVFLYKNIVYYFLCAIYFCKCISFQGKCVIMPWVWRKWGREKRRKIKVRERLGNVKYTAHWLGLHWLCRFGLKLFHWFMDIIRIGTCRNQTRYRYVCKFETSPLVCGYD